MAVISFLLGLLAAHACLNGTLEMLLSVGAPSRKVGEIGSNFRCKAQPVTRVMLAMLQRINRELRIMKLYSGGLWA